MRIPTLGTIGRLLAALGPLNLALLAGPAFASTASEWPGSPLATRADQLLYTLLVKWKMGAVILVYVVTCAVLALGALTASAIALAMRRPDFGQDTGRLPGLTAALLAPYLGWYAGMAHGENSFKYAFSLGWFVTSALWALAAALGHRGSASSQRET